MLLTTFMALQTARVRRTPSAIARKPAPRGKRKVSTPPGQVIEPYHIGGNNPILSGYRRLKILYE
jgi:hypothetical protein